MQKASVQPSVTPAVASTTATCRAETQKTAATTIQRFFKGHSVRRLSQQKARASIEPVNISENDIPIELDQFDLDPNKSYVLFSVSSFRCIEIASQLPLKPTPIYLNDHTEKGQAFWRAIQELFASHADANSFAPALVQFRRDQESWFHAKVADQAPHDVSFIMGLIEKFGFEHIKAQVMRVTLLSLDLQERTALVKLKAQFLRQGNPEVLVYAGRLISTTQEDAVLILNNLHLLKPRLLIHLNHAPHCSRSSGDLINEKGSMSVASTLQELTEDLDVHFHNHVRWVNDDGSSELLFPWAAIQKQAVKLLLALLEDLLSQDLNLAIEAWPAIFLSMAGIDLPLVHYQYGNSPHQLNYIVNLPLPAARGPEIMAKLKARFPELRIGYPMLGERGTHPTHLLAVAIGFEKIDLVFKTYPDFLRAHPEVLERLLVNTPATVSRKLMTFFHRYHMSTCKSDCFEETLCAMVQKYYASRGVFLPVLVTRDSGFDSVPDLPMTNIYLTTPIAVAQHLEDFFNTEYGAGSAELCPHPVRCFKGEGYTQLNVKNSVLTSERFLAELAAVVEAYPQATVDRYWQLAGYTPPAAAASETPTPTLTHP